MKNLRIELRWGILFSLALMIWMFVEKSLGWHDEHISSQLGNHFMVLPVLYAIVYYFALREKRENYYKGIMSWQQGILCGGIVSAVVAILSPLTQYFIYHFISPDYFQNIIDYEMHKAHFPMSQKNAIDFFSMKSFIIQGVFFSLSMGIVVSAVLALFMRKKTEKK